MEEERVERGFVQIFRWLVAVMPPSEEESQWLVGSGGGTLSTPGGLQNPGTGERSGVIRGVRYTEEMTTQPNEATAAAGVGTASADSAEHDLIDSTADSSLLAQFHEDAIKQVFSIIHIFFIIFTHISISPVSFSMLLTVRI